MRHDDLMNGQHENQSGGYQANSKSLGREHLTRHANRRAQQRAMSRDCVPLIKAFGRRSYDGRGGVTYLMTWDSVDLLIRALGRIPAIERLEGVYVVLDADNENAVITIGHRW